MGLRGWARGQLARLAWREVEREMPIVKKFAPLIGSAVLVGAVVLRALGQTEAAGAVEAIGSAVGLTVQSPVSAAEFAAAFAALSGIVLKIRAEIAKTKA